MVIGAGIAGMACAARLRTHDINVKVLDKGRGVGGRMATRRVSVWQWDHGMQYMTGDHPAFRKLLEDLPSWNRASTGKWYVGEPSQNQLVKSLSRGIDLSLQTRVTKLRQRHDERWVLTTDDPSQDFVCDAIAVAVPAPQASTLLPRDTAFADLEGVEMNPCWALMVATPDPLDLPDVLESPHEHIAWCAANHTKPGRPQGHGQYVLHATAAWSESHLECSSDAAMAALLEYFNDIAGQVDVSYAAAHRWRYALTKSPLNQPFLFSATHRIGVCGDWCLGARVEHGYLSGSALGEHMAERL